VAYTAPSFNTGWAARQLHLPQVLVGELREGLREDRLLEILGDAGPFGFRYAATQRGRERAARLLEVSGYVGPAPVSLAAYTAMLEWQLARAPAVAPEHVAGVIADLVLPEQAEHLAGLAISSGRSLFLYGPPGNGKTSLGRALHDALRGELWIPHCIGIDSNIIRVFDPQCHRPADEPTDSSWAIDRRWVRIRRPQIVVGGEMTLESFDLTYSPSLRYYEAPLHVKANGGSFLIDDFGRQRVDPHELLNRWIVPLEHRIDYLTLHTGQKIQVPFLLTLFIATNLDVGEVTDPAFLRRMGYRLYLGAPTPELYAQIFDRYAAHREAAVAPGLIARLLERYRSEGRELRSCEPRDLIERAVDICRYRGRPLELDDDVVDLAWTGYFGAGSAEG
jgi:predicted ATPase with chaperone activity